MPQGGVHHLDGANRRTRTNVEQHCPHLSRRARHPRARLPFSRLRVRIFPGSSMEVFLGETALHVLLRQGWRGGIHPNCHLKAVPVTGTPPRIHHSGCDRNAAPPPPPLHLSWKLFLRSSVSGKAHPGVPMRRRLRQWSDLPLFFLSPAKAGGLCMHGVGGLFPGGLAQCSQPLTAPL